MSDEQEKTMTHEQFTRLLAFQYGGCALCGKECHLDLDHDHRTMLVRGLVCRDCNRLLDEYEKKRRRFLLYEAYLNDPPTKALGLSVIYKPAPEKSRAS